MGYIYVLLTRPRTAFSGFIGFMEGCGFTHASIALGDGADDIYSFARRFARLPVPASLTREDTAGSFLHRHPFTRCALYRIEVDDGTLSIARSLVETMYFMRTRYSYSLIGAALCKLDIAHKLPRRYFCSQFVAEVLSRCGAVTLHKDASLMKPEDLCELPGLELVYSGELSGAPGAEKLYAGSC